MRKAILIFSTVVLLGAASFSISGNGSVDGIVEPDEKGGFTSNQVESQEKGGFT